MSRKVFRRSVTTTSTTLKDIGEIGDKRFENGETYRLVYTSASLASGAILTYASATGSADYEVQTLTAHTQPVYGWNDTGATVPALSYFWALVEGNISLTSGLLGAALTGATGVALNSAEKYIDWTSASTSLPCGQSIKAIASNASGTIRGRGLGA